MLQVPEPMFIFLKFYLVSVLQIGHLYCFVFWFSDSLSLPFCCLAHLLSHVLVLLFFQFQNFHWVFLYISLLKLSISLVSLSVCLFICFRHIHHCWLKYFYCGCFKNLFQIILQSWCWHLFTAFYSSILDFLGLWHDNFFLKAACFYYVRWRENSRFPLDLYWQLMWEVLLVFPGQIREVQLPSWCSLSCSGVPTSSCTVGPLWIIHGQKPHFLFLS